MIRTGRPRLDNPRTEIRRVRFTADEAALIDNAIHASGLTRAEWMRLRLLTAAKRSR